MIWRATLEDGQQILFELGEPGARIRVDCGSGWQSTPFTAADAAQDPGKAAELVAHWLQADHDDVSEVEAVERVLQ